MVPPTTFHPFPKLPWELRNEIWKFSIRPLNRPSAHIFCVEERKPQDSEAKELDVICSPIALWHGKYNLHITVPDQTMSCGSSAPGNPSAYMIDGGLWTACKESRVAMERAFKHQMWDAKRRAYPQYREARKTFLRSRAFRLPSLSESATSAGSSSSRSPAPPAPSSPYAGLEYETHLVPATGFFLSASSSALSSSALQGTAEADQQIAESKTFPRYFTLLPHQDLFIIRLSPRTLSDSTSSWRSLEHGFPLWSPKMGFYGFGKGNGLALEFDPSWQKSENASHISRTLSEAIMHFADLGALQTIWLIDYRLKPRDDVPVEKREPTSKQQVWHGGDGRRYVEMYSQLIEDGGEHLKRYYTEGIDGEDSATAEGSCHFFIETFEWGNFGDLYERQSADSDNPTSRFAPYVGILACLP